MERFCRCNQAANQLNQSSSKRRLSYVDLTSSGKKKGHSTFLRSETFKPRDSAAGREEANRHAMERPFGEK